MMELHHTRPKFEGASFPPSSALSFTCDSALEMNSAGRAMGDYLIADSRNGIFILADGVIRTAIDASYPYPSPALEAAQIFSQAAHGALLEFLPASDPEPALRSAMQIGNVGIADLNPIIPENGAFPESDHAGTAAFAGFVQAKHFHWANLGTCVGYAVHEDGVRRFTSQQHEAIAAEHEKVGSEDVVAMEMQRQIREIPEHSSKYEIFSGDASVLHCIEGGSVALTGIRRLIFVSDGVDFLLQRNPQLLWHARAAALANLAGNLEERLRIRSNDKAVIIVDF